jgi:c-di-GMP-binding flagellar brake protein YcgR
MNELVMLHQVSPIAILQDMYEVNIPLHMSSFCSGRWQINRVMLTDVRADNFDIKVSPRKKNQTVQLKPNQSVGISFQYDFGQDTFIFDTKVVALKSSVIKGDEDQIIALEMPEQIELVQKQSFDRVQVPASMEVEVALWHKDGSQSKTSHSAVQVLQGFKGRLVDISAGGLQVAVERSQGPLFQKEQFVSLEFVPLPDATSLKFNAYVRQVIPDADQDYVLLGLQVIGLEASAEGRLILSRICSLLEQYRRMSNT